MNGKQGIYVTNDEKGRGGDVWEFFFKKLDHYTQNIQRKVSVYHNHSSHKIILN
jgi:hypothetical protein